MRIPTHTLHLRKLGIFFTTFITLFSAIIFTSPTPISHAATSSNLLTNPGAETNDFTGWTKVDGGNGWAISGLFNSGTHSFISSYIDGTLSQEINLATAGYNSTAMDAQPQIDASVYVVGYDAGSGSNDPYSVHVELRDASHAALVTWDTGTLTATANWTQVAHTFSNYGTGVRYIYYRLTGRSSAFWAGQFGAAFDDASVTITTQDAPTGFTSASYSDANADGSIDRVTVVINNGALTTCAVSNGEIASDWTYSGGSIGGSLLSATCNLSTATITFTLSGTSDQLTGGGGALTIAYNDTDGDHSIANITGSLGTVSAFTLADAAAPVLQEGTPVSTPTNDNTPNYSFFATESGTITYAGGCTSATTSASASVANTITLSALTDGTYSSCTIKVTDGTGNQSALLTLTSFRIDTTTPSISAFTASIAGTTLTATWTTNEAASTTLSYGINGSLGSSTIEADTSPRTTSHSVTLTGLQACGSYTVRAQSTDAASNTIQSSNFDVPAEICGVGLPPAAFSPPTIPQGGFKLSINNGAASTSSPEVILNFTTSSDVAKVSVSNHESFEGETQIALVKNMSWNLCWHYFVTKTPSVCPAGTYTVYAKFFTSWGHPSGTVSATINYNPKNGSTTVINNGLLLDKGTIYLIAAGRKYGFTNMTTFTGLGYSLPQVKRGDASMYTSGGILDKPDMAHVVGSWILSNKTVYYISSKGLIPVPTWGTFVANSQGSFITPANPADLLKQTLPTMTIPDPRVYAKES